MKIKYLLTIPLGYLILSLSRKFSLTVFRYNIPLPLDEIIYVSLDILAVLFLFDEASTYITSGTTKFNLHPVVIKRIIINLHRLSFT